MALNIHHVKYIFLINVIFYIKIFFIFLKLPFNTHHVKFQNDLKIKHNFFKKNNGTAKK